MRGFQIKSYVGTGGKRNIMYIPPTINITSSKIRVFYPKNKKKKEQRGSEVKQTVRTYQRLLFITDGPVGRLRYAVYGKSI